MNQRLKRSEEARLGTLCKYTAPAATSRIYMRLIYLLPVKETTIIIFTLRAAAPASPSSAPPSATADDSITGAIFQWRRPPLRQHLSCPGDHHPRPQITICCHTTCHPTVYVRPCMCTGGGRNGLRGQERFPWKSNAARN